MVPTSRGRHLYAAEVAPAHRARANLLLTMTAAIWGFGFVAQRMGAEHVGAFTFNGVRFALGAVSLVPLIWLLDRRAGTPAPAVRTANGSALVPGLVAGSLLFTAAALQQVGIESTTAGKASFITGLYIVLVPIMGLALRHRTTRATWVGIALAVVGLYLLSVTDDFTMATGDLLVLVGAVFWAGHILVIDHYTRHVEPLRLAASQFAACALISAGAALVFEDNPFGGMSQAVIPILYGGLVVVGVAYTLQVVAQKDAHPAHAAMILSLETVFGALGGALLLSEQMSARGYTGCALMLTGILVSQWPSRARDPGDHPVPVPEPMPAHPAADEVR